LKFAENNFGKHLMAFFAKQPNPFKRLINAHDPLDKKYQDVVNIAVHSYQAHSYLNMIESEYGSEIHHIARAQIHNLIDLNKYNYDFFANTTKLIDHAIEIGQLEVTEQGKVTQIPLELIIAITILLGLPGSPHYAAEQQSRESEIHKMAEDVDQKFAQYLLKGKAQIAEWFSHLSKTYMKTITRN
jgi:hypothetical protein